MLYESSMLISCAISSFVVVIWWYVLSFSVTQGVRLNSLLSAQIVIAFDSANDS